MYDFGGNFSWSPVEIQQRLCKILAAILAGVLLSFLPHAL
jgi:hypothetical protein